MEGYEFKIEANTDKAIENITNLTVSIELCTNALDRLLKKINEIKEATGEKDI